MEMFYPFMLFILQLPSDGDQVSSLQRHPVLYRTQEECLAAGNKILADYAAERRRYATTEQIFCLRTPNSDEYEALYDKMHSDRAAERKK